MASCKIVPPTRTVTASSQSASVLSPCDSTTTVTNEIVFNGSLVEHYARHRAKPRTDDYEVIVFNGTHKSSFKHSSVLSLARSFDMSADLTMAHIICYLYYYRDHFGLGDDVGIDQLRLLHLGKPYLITDVRSRQLSVVNLRQYNTIHLIITESRRDIYRYFNVENYFRFGQTQVHSSIFSRRKRSNSAATVSTTSSTTSSIRRRKRSLVKALLKVFGSSVETNVA
ncbi:hypothetical protein DICA3_B12464 [Diutina catenulata]